MFKKLFSAFSKSNLKLEDSREVMSVLTGDYISKLKCFDHKETLLINEKKFNFKMVYEIAKLMIEHQVKLKKEDIKFKVKSSESGKKIFIEKDNIGISISIQNKNLMMTRETFHIKSVVKLPEKTPLIVLDRSMQSDDYLFLTDYMKQGPWQEDFQEILFFLYCKILKYENAIEQEKHERKRKIAEVIDERKRKEKELEDYYRNNY